MRQDGGWATGGHGALPDGRAVGYNAASHDAQEGAGNKTGCMEGAWSD